MATPAQISNFYNQYLPMAQQIGEQTGDDPNVILGQFALETGYGQSMAGTNNLGNITNIGGGFANYASPSDFATAYTNLLESNYPGALDQGSNAAGFVSGLSQAASGGSYFGNQSPSSYLSSLTGTIANLTGDASSSGSNGLPDWMNEFDNFMDPGGQIGGDLSGESSTPAFSSGGLLSFVGEIAERGALIVLGMVFIIGAFFLLGQRSAGASFSDIARRWQTDRSGSLTWI